MRSEGIMNHQTRYLFINSTLAFVAAFLVTTLVHELGHFIAYFLLDMHPTLYHNQVVVSDGNALSTPARIFGKSAGMLLCLLQGGALFFFLNKNKKNNAFNLFLLWSGLLGFVNFFGYWMIVPFTEVGDSGAIARLLHIPLWAQYLIALAALDGLFFIVRKMGTVFNRFLPATSEKRMRHKMANAILLYPLVLGSLINVLLALPAPAAISLIYPATSSFVLMIAYRHIVEAQPPLTKTSSCVADRLSPILIVLALVFVLINRVLVNGWKI